MSSNQLVPTSYEETNLPQLQQRLLHVATQLDHMQSQLDLLQNETLNGASQIAILAQNFTNPQRSEQLTQQLAKLTTQVENNAIQLEEVAKKMVTAPRREQLETLSQSVQKMARQEELVRLSERVDQVAQSEQLEEIANRLATQDELANLAAEFKRLSRTQFKNNTLVEGKEQQTATAINALQEIAIRREAIQDERSIQERNRLNEIRSEARGDLVADLFPALDGLELAIQNGQALRTKIAASAQPKINALPTETVAPPQEQSWFRRLFQSDPIPPLPPRVRKDPQLDEMRDSLTAWLDGLNLVRDRFLALLTAEGVQPLGAVDQPFDPRQHVAVESVPRDDVAASTIVRVIRQGYRQQNRVLRYAEVVVSVTQTKPEKKEVGSTENL